MITIYKNSTTKQCAMQIVQALKRVDKSNLDVMHTVIVPDRSTLEMERLILQEIGGSFNVQVLTFRRLASRILPKYEYLSKQAGIMALAGIIQDNKRNLKCFTKGVDSPGFVADMYDTISMMKYCKIQPSKLINDKLPTSVRGKAEDIATLYQAYLDYTQNRFVDSADKLDLLCDQLPNVQSVKDGYFYLCDFDNLTAQEFALVEQLALVSQGVTVSCCVGKNFADKHLYLDDIYDGLLKVCERNQITPSIIENTHMGTNAVTSFVGEHLFRYITPAPIANNNFVEVFQGETRYSEVYNLACKVQKYVRGGGRFKDVYVVTSDINKYVNSIANVFEQLQIPYFCDRQFELADQPYAQFVLDYLALQRNNGRLQNVLSFVKNYLFCGNFDGKTDVDDVYKFENYCLKYNVSYNYDNFALGLDDYFYQGANQFRQKFNNLYKSNVFPQSAKAVDYVQLIRDLLASQQVAERNNVLAEQQQLSGNAIQANVTNQTVEKFEQVLLQAETIMDNRFVTLEEFAKALTAAVASVKISVIPQHNDCVVFANMAKARKHDIKFLALLGANYGAMPIVKKDCKLLTDANIQALTKENINVEPQIHTENKRERFSLFQLLQEPTEKLYISYTTTDGADSLKPSPFVEQICKMLIVGYKKNQANGKMEPVLLSATDVEMEDIFTEKQAISKVVLNKRKIADKQIVSMPSYNVLSQAYSAQADKYQFAKNGQNITIQGGDKLFFKSDRTSVSQLTTFFECPYRFFIKYGLNVNPREIAQLQASDLGTILHDTLDHYVKASNDYKAKVAKQGNVPEQPTTAQAITDTKIVEQIAMECFDKALGSDFYTALKTDPQMQGILAQLRAEAIQMCKVVEEQFAHSKFQNVATELSFDGKDEPGHAPLVTINYGQGQFNLNGKIDRIDGYNQDIIIIDYKSSDSASDYNEKNLYIGQKLQLLVYVRAAQDFFKQRPVGYYYFAMHNDFGKGEDKKTYTYRGRTLRDMSVASAIDTKIASSIPGQPFKSEKLGLSITAKGSFNGRSTGHISAEQFDHQVTYATELIKRAGALMHKGFVAVTPYKDKCKYCDYKDICDYDDVFNYEPRQVKNKVGAQTITNVVTKGVVAKGEDDE
ncbi:MAG: PD-(D/E)XK nuclease family protein [Clostridia bacterium]|nr:PD-(D/E)XK nuclease family protein [Clostridia bacterium]